jgi:RNA polymerase sigma-70 factor (ECF subfamily)
VAPFSQSSSDDLQRTAERSPQHQNGLLAVTLLPHLSSEPASIAPLLEQAREGSATAIGNLLEAARSYLLLQADQELPQSLRAKVGPSDIVQETAIDAQRDFLRFRGTTQEQLYAWLRTILHNNVTDAVRRFDMSQKRTAKRETSLSVIVDRCGISVLPLGSNTPDHSAIRREDAALLAGMLTRVPDDYQTVLRLRYWDGLTFPEIAIRIGRSEEAARKLWYRALARLTLELQARPPEQQTPPSSS